MNAISIAASGMAAATAQLGVAATQAANPADDMDIVRSVVGQIEAETAFAADAKVMATADKMIGLLLDITA